MTRYDPLAWSPSADAGALAAVAGELRAGGVHVAEEQPLGPWTTLGVGGPARFFAEIADDPQVAVLMRALSGIAPGSVPLLILGRGSNLLIADSGWPGLAVRLGAGFKAFTRDGLAVTAGGGVSMPALAAWTATQGLTGLEFAAGIPATLGGSVRMNAGAHGGDTARHLLSVRLAMPGAAPAAWVHSHELNFGYRHSELPARAIVIGAKWLLAADHPDAIRARLDGLRAWRRATQPLRQRNCGSVFTNPGNDSAGRLVDAAGLKAMRRGGAQVSERHANFIVVNPPCRAADVYGLITHMRRVVHESGGPLLQPEVRVVGDFSAEVGDAPV
ncbi:MAG: UDP-N-acetylmuramate dehydrogenase [Pseudonocardiales bacterium]